MLTMIEGELAVTDKVDFIKAGLNHDDLNLRPASLDRFRATQIQAMPGPDKQAPG